MYAADELYDTAELEEADVVDQPCRSCGASEVVEITDETQTILICAECGSDEP